ncbi:phosphopantetheine-binding protein [Saccharopolyspora taberi]|uniref:Carrier domain-containing protein n=1 Tax=Saccharopolyspora taberi TaxID=60895 RepID=A0ABN3V462_9PSEU
MVHSEQSPDSGGGEVSAGPKTRTERVLAEIWAEVLQLPRVGVEQNFFDLGGHSLLVHVVHERITGEFPKTPPLVELFRHPTVRSLARYLDEPGETAAEERTGRRTGRLARRRAQIGSRDEQIRGDEHE